MNDLKGTVVKVRLEGFIVSMRVLDTKQAYGVNRVLVVPVSGSGEAWINASRILTITE